MLFDFLITYLIDPTLLAALLRELFFTTYSPDALLLTTGIAGLLTMEEDTPLEENRRLRKELEEKNLLLQEIHHRIKNNLAITAGLLELQVHEAQYEESASTLRSAQLRIQSMAILHEMLYNTDHYKKVGFDTYIKSLTDRLHDIYLGGERKIDCILDIEPVKLSIDQAVPAALMINELISNAYKHAFSNQSPLPRRINVNLSQQESTLHLKIHDNGCGIPESTEYHESMGMHIIENLKSQLEADLRISNQNGARIDIFFETDL